MVTVKVGIHGSGANSFLASSDSAVTPAIDSLTISCWGSMSGMAGKYQTRAFMTFQPCPT